MDDILSFPHIRTFVRDDHVVVEVGDEELRDYIEDYLLEEYNLECEWMSFAANGIPHELVFPVGTTLALVNDALRALDPAELERIYRLSNA